MANRIKKHPTYYKIKGYQIINQISDEKAADALGVCVRTFREKRDGYGDFTLSQGDKLSEILGQSKDVLFSYA